MKDKKSWYKSKTKWAGILSAIMIIMSSPTPLEPIVIGKAVIALLGVFGVRDALDDKKGLIR